MRTVAEAPTCGLRSTASGKRSLGTFISTLPHLFSPLSFMPSSSAPPLLPHTHRFHLCLPPRSGPCIRGHRSSKCDHRDRVLVEVRKPGRPLSSCPHPSGSCSCERVVINYTIPKTSECACPSDVPQPTPFATNSGRVQKSRNRKSSTFNSATLEKAIKACQDGETDASSILTQTPTSAGPGCAIQHPKGTDRNDIHGQLSS